MFQIGPRGTASYTEMRTLSRTASLFFPSIFECSVKFNSAIFISHGLVTKYNFTNNLNNIAQDSTRHYVLSFFKSTGQKAYSISFWLCTIGLNVLFSRKKHVQHSRRNRTHSERSECTFNGWSNIVLVFTRLIYVSYVWWIYLSTVYKLFGFFHHIPL